jgi:dipeptidyl aminopeptidase/acylaminoacyl peptidase
MKFKIYHMSHALLLFLMMGMGMMAMGQKKEGESEDQYRARMEQERAILMQQRQQYQNIRLEDFFKNPDISNFVISPDGESYAYLKPLNGRKNIAYRTEEENKEIFITSETERDLHGLVWANNEVLLFAKDNGGDENDVIYAIHASTTKITPLTSSKGVKSMLLDLLPQDANHVLIETNERNSEFFDVYKVNVYNGAMEMVAQNPGNVNTWIVDNDGHVLVATVTDGVNSEILYRKSEQEKEWTSIKKSNYIDQISPIGFTKDNQSLYCLSNDGRNYTALVTILLATGDEEQTLYEHDRYDISSFYFSDQKREMEYIEYVGEKTERVFFDQEAKASHAALSKALNGWNYYIVSRSKNEKKCIVRTYSDISLGSYFLYDIDKRVATKIQDVAPWIKADMMCEMKPISYTSRDGLMIHGYLTLPKNGNGKMLPLIVNPHGGPWARDEWGFNSEVQFLASRGYAVLQINFRGSTGYGKKFWMASFKQWGQTMQNDITDGVNYLIKNGTADPSRIAIYGASYGGYATLAGLAFTPDLYACGVDYVGVSNLFTFMNTIPPYWKPYLEMMYEMVGNPESDTEMMKLASPVFHVDKIKAPLLIAQGAKDPRVNIKESDQIAAALKNNGGKVEYIVEPEEGHGFSNEEARFNFYRKMEAFLSQNMIRTK